MRDRTSTVQALNRYNYMSTLLSLPTLMAKRRGANEAWMIQHDKIVHDGHPITNMLIHWRTYAERYKRKHGHLIGEHLILGPAWAEIGRSVGRLLSGELDGLHAPTIDQFIVDTLRHHGVKSEVAT